jgi:uncharacterized damage-inducible protein DinB
VAVAGRELVGTVTVCGPYDVETAPWTAEVPWFRERDTAHFHQFAVDPAYQGQGWAGAWCRSAKTGRARAAFAAWRWTRPSRPPNCARCTADWAMPTWARCSGRARTTAASSCSATWTARRLREHLQTLARYNLWATRRLQAHVDALPEADYRRDLGLFFHSIHGTLNHLLVGEHLLWFPALRKAARRHRAGRRSRARPRPLAERLREGALAWMPLIEVWPEDRLLGTLEYTRMNGQAVVAAFAATLAHVFNHGTHHRGQISAALTAWAAPAPNWTW